MRSRRMIKRAMTGERTLSVPAKFKRKAQLPSRRQGVGAVIVERGAKREKDRFEGLDGVWEGRDINLGQLREKAWSRE